MDKSRRVFLRNLQPHGYGLSKRKVIISTVTWIGLGIILEGGDNMLSFRPSTVIRYFRLEGCNSRTYKGQYTDKKIRFDFPHI